MKSGEMDMNLNHNFSTQFIGLNRAEKKCSFANLDVKKMQISAPAVFAGSEHELLEGGEALSSGS